MGRIIVGIIAGLVVAAIVMIAISFLGGSLFPSSVRANPMDVESVRAAFTSLPLGGQLILPLSAIGAALAGSALAKWLSGHDGAAWTVGILVTLYSLANALVLPMAGWMQALGVVGPLVATWLGTRTPARAVPVRDAQREGVGDGDI